MCNNSNSSANKGCIYEILKTILVLQKEADMPGCCATCRVLIATVDDDTVTYTATDSFFTISLNCICMLKCLADTYVEML